MSDESGNSDKSVLAVRALRATNGLASNVELAQQLRRGAIEAARRRSKDRVGKMEEVAHEDALVDEIARAHLNAAHERLSTLAHRSDRDRHRGERDEGCCRARVSVAAESAQLQIDQRTGPAPA